MKKSILSLVAVVALSLMGTGAFAQSSIGIFNGARSFASKVDGADKTESTAGSTFGISYEHNTRLGSLLGVSAGVDLGVFGANDFFDIKDYTVVESYIDIPIRGKVFIPLGNSVDLNVFAGFVPSYCLGSWGKVDKDDDATNRFKDNEDHKRFDVMLGGGVGLDIIKHIKLAASFDFGVLDRNASDAIQYHQGVLKFTAAYIF